MQTPSQFHCTKAPSYGSFECHIVAKLRIMPTFVFIELSIPSFPCQAKEPIAFRKFLANHDSNKRMTALWQMECKQSRLVYGKLDTRSSHGGVRETSESGNRVYTRGTPGTAGIGYSFGVQSARDPLDERYSNSGSKHL